MLRAAAWDIELGLQLQALGETCAYIEERLARCRTFASSREVLQFAVDQAPKDGFICEFGVFKGSSINFLAKSIKPRLVHGFDSFEGLPENWRTGFDKGFFRTAIPAVESNVVLHNGWFDDTLPKFVAASTENKAALIHVDCDLYSSTEVIFRYLGPFIRKGTIIVFDEYFNYPGWKRHEHRALQEFCASSRSSYEYLAYNRLHEQVVVAFS